MINSLLFFTQLLAVLFFILIAIRGGKEFLMGFLAMLILCMNLFVCKQITLFGIHITATDGLAMGYFLGFNLLQEFFGQPNAKKMMLLSLLINISFLIVTSLHLAFIPNGADTMHDVHGVVFGVAPRIILSSIFCLFFVQFLDAIFFTKFREKLQGRFFVFRLFCSLFLATLLDTALFSFLALYGQVDHLLSVSLFSLVAKFFAMLLSIPFITFAKRYVYEI